jgi:hypothetical protein
MMDNSHGNILHIEQRAKRVCEALRRLLADEEETRAELQKMVAELTSLQARMAEWVELHHLLHRLLSAFAPFHARLIPPREGRLDAAERQLLLQNWRPCQAVLDRLVDFAEEVEHIGRPFQREGRELDGERWVVEVVALQSLLEDALKEEDVRPESLLELAEELVGTCHRHLALADHKLKATVDGLQRLSTSLLGGLV